MKNETYAATIETNVLGVLLSLKQEMRVMQAQKAGSIINVSSTLSHRGTPGASLYVASKHAVEGLTQSAALEGAPFGVRVNSVAPGPTGTGMLNRFTGTAEKKAVLITGVPLNRMGAPEELAEAIVFMASPKAAFITGTTLVVDGGKLAR
jgi:NAD(P)-dependent dehydrogenase (short-subunit alcohol dehydrogenase family)